MQKKLGKKKLVNVGNAAEAQVHPEALNAVNKAQKLVHGNARARSLTDVQAKEQENLWKLSRNLTSIFSSIIM